MPESESVLSQWLNCQGVDDLERQFENSAEHKSLKQNHDIFSSLNLHEFVDAIDAAGGWGAPSTKPLVDRFRFHKDLVNETLDPFSEEYVQEQLCFYKRLTGQLADQKQTELTSFNLQDHLQTANPYASVPAHLAAMHASRISLAIKQSKLELHAKVLDMGCGWGFSSELMTFLGLQVTGVDINPQFCELVNQRAALRKLPVVAHPGSFENIPAQDNFFDGVVYYECLHHAIRPWVALEKSHAKLKTGGKLILAGEPINTMWKHWGLRLDAESMYVIKKFGWFESGWTLDFLEQCLLKVGYHSIEKVLHEGPIGWVITATK